MKCYRNLLDCILHVAGLGLLIAVMTSCSIADIEQSLVEEEMIYLDPAVGRVVLFNDSKDFVIQETGVFNASVGPGERLETNVRCYGRVQGLLDIYRIIGKGVQGQNILSFYGQRKYSLHVDGKNIMFRGIELDAYQVFRDSSFYPTKKREQWIVPSDPCGMGPKMMIRYGG